MHIPNVDPEFKDWLEALAFVATIIGIPLAILVFWWEQRKTRLQHESDVFDRAGDKYIDYLILCLNNSELDCFDFTHEELKVAKGGPEHKKLILFTILISVLETSFILYKNARSSVRIAQWQGWLDYIILWFERDDFRNAWRFLSPQFDCEFVEKMEHVIQSVDRRPPRSSRDHLLGHGFEPKLPEDFKSQVDLVARSKQSLSINTSSNTRRKRKLRRRKKRT